MSPIFRPARNGFDAHRKKDLQQMIPYYEDLLVKSLVKLRNPIFYTFSSVQRDAKGRNPRGLISTSLSNNSAAEQVAIVSM